MRNLLIGQSTADKPLLIITPAFHKLIETTFSS